MRPRHPAVLIARLIVRAITIEPVDHEALSAFIEAKAEKETAAAPAS